MVKGSSQGRRRFLDLILSQTVPGYLVLLLRFAKSLKSRNALLKQVNPPEAELEAFTAELVLAGTAVMEARNLLVPRIAPLVRFAFRRVAGDADDMSVVYQPGFRGDLAVALANARARERLVRTTVVGPHRDDLLIQVNDRSALQYTSEGQKRTLAVALKLAQAEYLSEVHGSPPVLLIDDVMGELDAERRAAFVPLLNQVFRSGGQVFMTCTEENWPRELSQDLIRWTVQEGKLVAR